MLIEQLIDLRKVRTENLKFRTDIWDWVINLWSLTQQMIIYKGRLLKKSLNWKLKFVLSLLVNNFSPITTWLSNIAYHLLPIWLQILVAICSESCQTSFLCCFGLQQLLANNKWLIPSKISFYIKKWWFDRFVTARNLQSIQTFLAFQLSQYCKSGSMFPQASLSLRLLLTLKCPVFVLCTSSWSTLPKLCLSAALRARPLILQSRLSVGIAFGPGLWSDCLMTGRGLKLDSNLNSVTWSTGCEGFICPEITNKSVLSLNPNLALSKLKTTPS